MPRSIFDTMRHIQAGHFVDELTDEMAGLVTAVNESGGSGKLVIEINVKKLTRGGAMSVTAKHKVQKPKEQTVETLMFPTDDGSLVTEDPRQTKLPLVQVAGAIEQSELKRAG